MNYSTPTQYQTFIFLTEPELNKRSICINKKKTIKTLAKANADLRVLFLFFICLSPRKDQFAPILSLTTLLLLQQTKKRSITKKNADYILQKSYRKKCVHTYILVPNFYSHTTFCCVLHFFDLSARKNVR